MECCRHVHSPEAYLADVLQLLPGMTNQDDLGALLPSRGGQPPAAVGPVVDVEATVCLS
ncbi:MAG: transposase domain-containing protein [Verrucomicrobiota bacterium]